MRAYNGLQEEEGGGHGKFIAVKLGFILSKPLKRRRKVRTCPPRTLGLDQGPQSRLMTTKAREHTGRRQGLVAQESP